MRRAASRAVRGAEHVDLENAPHALDAHLDEPRSRRDDPGVDHDPGQEAERLRRLFEDGDNVGLDGDVALERDGAPARLGDRAHDLFRRVDVVAVIDPDRPAVLGGEQGRSAADAARRAGDQDGFGQRRPPIDVRGDAERAESNEAGRGSWKNLELSFLSFLFLNFLGFQLLEFGGPRPYAHTNMGEIPSQ